jgi:hypothetical protein
MRWCCLKLNIIKAYYIRNLLFSVNKFINVMSLKIGSKVIKILNKFLS